MDELICKFCEYKGFEYEFCHDDTCNLCGGIEIKTKIIVSAEKINDELDKLDVD